MSTFLTGYLAQGSGSSAGTFVEISGNGYARQAVTLTQTTPGKVSISPGVTFAATGTWATVTQDAIYDAATGGNLIFTWQRATPYTLTSGKTHTLSPASIEITLQDLVEAPPLAVVSWESGALVGTILKSGSSVYTGSAVQVAGGVCSAFVTGGGSGSPGGSTGYLQFNSGGSFGGTSALTLSGSQLTLSGDISGASGTLGATTPLQSISTSALTLGGNQLTLGGALTTSGAFGVTLTATGTTNLTLPTSGTLFTTSGGTVSGATTLSASGTALTVNNNATITGQVTAGSIIGNSAANLSLYCSSSSTSILLRSSSGILMNIGTSSNNVSFNGSSINSVLTVGGTNNVVTADVPVTLNTQALAISGAYSTSVNSLLTNNSTTYTGTSTTSVFAINLSPITFNVATGSSNEVGVLNIGCATGAALNGNVYAIDINNAVNVTPAATGLETHAIRATSTITANMGGTSGGTSGIAIGAKAAVSQSMTSGGYLGLAMALEVVELNADATTNDIAGIYLQGNNTQNSVRTSAGIMAIETTSGGTGWKNIFQVGAASYYSAAVAGTTQNILYGYGGGSVNGINLTGLTLTGSAWLSTGATIDNAGNCTFASVTLGSSGPEITTGSAAPSATQPKGSIYIRTGGGVGTTLYVSQGGGTWNAVSGV